MHITASIVINISQERVLDIRIRKKLSWRKFNVGRGIDMSEQQSISIMDLLKEKGLSRYQFAKENDIPLNLFMDICDGEQKLETCSDDILFKLSKAFEMSTDELFQLKVGLPVDNHGKPKDRTYLETGLPGHLQKALEDYIEGRQEGVSHLDCLWGELYGSINACQWENSITKEHADYLRKKYLFGEGDAND